MLANPPPDPANHSAPAPAPGEVVPFQVGELVAQRYRITRILNEDSLGWVFEVSEAGTAPPADADADGGEPPLALRLLRPRFGPDGAALSPEALTAWRAQMALLRDLRSPGVVPVHELCLGDEHGRVYAVRDAIELTGQSLATALAGRPGGLPEPEAVRLCASIAEAVEGAHARGVLHLGLSPRRIYLVPNGGSAQIKVVDFALLPPSLAARYCEPGYLAPEQVEGQPCDRRTDQFAIAVIFYEMLSGQPAFIGATDEDRDTILARVVGEDPIPLALSRPIELALARALSRSRTVRFPGLGEFVCALGVDGVAWSVVRPPGPARSQLSPPPVRRTPLYIPIVLGAALAFAVLAVLGIFVEPSPLSLFRRSPPPPVRAPKALPDLAAPPTPPEKPPAVATRPGPPDLGARPASTPPVVATRPPGPGPTPPTPPNGPRPPSGNGATATPARPTGANGPAGTTGPATASVPGNNNSINNGGGAPLTDKDLQISTEGGPLAPRYAERLRFCLNLIHARPPFTVYLDGFKDTLYVSDRTSNPEIRLSTDFRNCLKNEVRGNIEAKSVTIKGIPKGKPAP